MLAGAECTHGGCCFCYLCTRRKESRTVSHSQCELNLRDVCQLREKLVSAGGRLSRRGVHGQSLGAGPRHPQLAPVDIARPGSGLDMALQGWWLLSLLNT